MTKEECVKVGKCDCQECAFNSSEDLCKRERVKFRKEHLKLFRLWSTMKTRCYNPNRHNYKNYGGRGIKICKEWENSFKFVNWALSNGYKDGLQIDRIDNNKGYSPDNCRFVTNRENANNRRNSIRIKFLGKLYTICELSKKYKKSEFTLYWWRRVYGEEGIVKNLLREVCR